MSGALNVNGRIAFPVVVVVLSMVASVDLQHGDVALNVLNPKMEIPLYI